MYSFYISREARNTGSFIENLDSDVIIREISQSFVSYHLSGTTNTMFYVVPIVNQGFVHFFYSKTLGDYLLLKMFSRKSQLCSLLIFRCVSGSVTKIHESQSSRKERCFTRQKQVSSYQMFYLSQKLHLLENINSFYFLVAINFKLEYKRLVNLFIFHCVICTDLSSSRNFC